MIWHGDQTLTCSGYTQNERDTSSHVLINHSIRDPLSSVSPRYLMSAYALNGHPDTPQSQLSGRAGNRTRVQKLFRVASTSVATYLRTFP